jgi:hypothetical protein
VSCESGYVFRSWGGSLNGSESNPALLTMDGDKAVTVDVRYVNWKNVVEYEIENLPRSSSDCGDTTGENDEYSNGYVVMNKTTAVIDDYIEFTLPSLDKKYYLITLTYEGGTAMGKYKMSINETPIGSECNMSANTGYQLTFVPGYALLKSGDIVRLTCTGSGDYGSKNVKLDKITLAGAITYQAEDLSYESNRVVAIQVNSQFSGGKSVLVNSTTLEDSIRFIIPNVEPGNYEVYMCYKKNSTRAERILSKMNGKYMCTYSQRAADDEYGCYQDLGNIDIIAGGDQVFSIKIPVVDAGKISVDQIQLLPGTSVTSFEAENCSFTSNKEVTTSELNQSASNQYYVEIYPDVPAVGDWIELSIPSIEAGTYNLTAVQKTNSDRGIVQVSVDGVNIGSVDSYQSTPFYQVPFQVGTVTFETTGTHTLRYTVTGKNASSSGYKVTPDRVLFSKN